jgi:uncharacterized repeat protein (TIGR01451 family)
LITKTKRRIGGLTAALIGLSGAIAMTLPAQAQEVDPGTGASAFKNCPGTTVDLGETITCTFVVRNIGDNPATIASLTETSPYPGGAVVNESCTLADGTVLDAGDTLNPGVLCAGDLTATIPDDPTLCGTSIVDAVTLALAYPGGLTAGAFATETTLVDCPPEITVTKEADELGKIGDPVSYVIEVCNTGDVEVTKTSVIDSLIGDISAEFAATIAAGACDEVTVTRDVTDTDPDPLLNTVTATYSAGTATATAEASDSTNLFQPSVDVTKTCGPAVVHVGDAVTCEIVVTNTSSDDTPVLINGTISDSLSGNLLDAANTAVVDSNCTATLAVDATCTIHTTRTVVAGDPASLSNTVTVNYNPTGFPNNITDAATATVTVERLGGEGCTPGYWKQPQHADSWVTYSPTDSFDAVFGVDITLAAYGKVAANPNPTLLDALNAGGGGINALARHAVAALLNSSNPDVASNYTTAEVIALVQDAVTAGGRSMAEVQALLAAANEQGCPLN